MFQTFRVGILLIGDFNQLPDSGLRNFPLTQIVRSPTRGKSVLDKMFTDCRNWYNTPVILPPVSRSDHCCVLLVACVNSKYQPTRVIKTGAATTKTVKPCLLMSCDMLTGCRYDTIEEINVVSGAVVLCYG